MTLNEYQNAALKTLLPQCDKLAYLSLKLGSEAGEVQSKVGKLLRGDYNDRPGDFHRDLIKELGDTLWYVAMVAKHQGYSLQEIAEANLSKLADRAERGVITGSGDNR